MSCADGKRVALPLLVTVVLLAFAAVAAAQDEPQYVREFRAYNAALQRGDADAAERHGRAAWEAAEHLRGDDRLTAILAFNYGQHLLFSNSKQAIVAIRRADALREFAGDALPGRTLDLYLAYLELVSGDNSRRNAEALREALAAVGEDDAELARKVATISLALAIMDFSAGRLRDADDSAAAAWAAVESVAPNDYESLAMAGITRGAALMLQQPRRESRILAAQDEFRKVRDLYPLQQDIETFEAGLAQALAWDFAATALLQSMGERIDPEDDGRMPALFERARDPGIRCRSIEWVSREAPEYPKEAIRGGYVGAVVVGFHLGDDLGVEGVRILAEVPAARFGEAVLEAARGWKAGSVEPDAPECRRNRLTRIRFVFD